MVSGYLARLVSVGLLADAPLPRRGHPPPRERRDRRLERLADLRPRTLGIPVILLDALKGFAPAFVGVLAVSHLCGILAGAAAMVGHARPLYLRFEKGGKMVATGGGVLLAVEPWVALAAGAVWAVTFLLSRYTSLASVASAIACRYWPWCSGLRGR